MSERAGLLMTLLVFGGIVGVLRAESPPADGNSRAGADEVPASRQFTTPLAQPDELASDDPRYGLLTPIGERGEVAPIVRMLHGQTAAERAPSQELNEYRREIRRIRHEHFGRMRVAEIREEGIERLSEFTDPGSFRVLIDELKDEQDDVLLGLMDHFGDQGDAGQGALAYLSITHDDAAIRHEAIRRMTAPPPGPVLFLIDQGIRHENEHIANRAAWLANALNVIDFVPMLIMHQVHRQRVQTHPKRGPFIFVGTQRAYIRDVVPVTGGGSAAFAPVVSTISKGVVLQVYETEVYVRRQGVHEALTALAGRAVDGPPPQFGYERAAWIDWYNETMVPAVNRSRRLEQLANPASGADGS